MTVFRVYADSAGDTHLATLALPLVTTPGEEGVRQVRGLLDIPASSVGVVEMLDPLPGGDLHPAPARRLLVLLRGAYEIETSTGETQRLRPGDCLLADDLVGKGHRTRDVGDERVAWVAIHLGSDWQAPAGTEVQQ